MNKILNKIEKEGRAWFNDIVNHETSDAQKKFGFNIGTGEHASWNNEADAFKHAFLSWWLSYYKGDDETKRLAYLCRRLYSRQWNKSTWIL